MSRQKEKFIVLDVETANDIPDTFTYDVGFVVADRSGKIYHEHSFVISDILGERKIQLLGNLIDLNFNHSLWNNGSTIALIMLMIIGVSMLLTKNVKKEENTRGGLW